MTANANWWRKGHRDPVHDEIIGHAKHLETLHRSRVYLDVIHERIYRGQAPMTRGLAPALSALAFHGYDAPRLNVTKSVVDTAVSKLGKDRPMPQAVVDDADWSVKRRARKMTRFIKSEMRASNFDAMSRCVLRKGTIRGTGCLKVSSDMGKIVVEDVAREELLIDPRDAQYGQPRQLIHRCAIPREVLAERYPEHRAEIMMASPAQPQWEDFYDEYGTTYLTEEDRIEVYEAWHLPSGCDADDGRHAIVMAGVTLDHDEWERDYFPFAFFHWSPPLRGFWGMGLVYELASIQEAINNIVRDIQRNIEYHGRAMTLARKGTVFTGHLTGRKPFLLEYEGPNAPQVVVPNAVSPAQLQMLDRLIQSAYDLTGVSMMSAQSRNPVGAGASGRALDNFYDIQSERFADVQAAYADMRMQGARLILDAACSMAEENEEKKRPYVTTWSEHGRMGRLDWKDVEMKREQYRLELEPVNFLPDTRAGKLAMVEQLAAGGVIDPKWTSALFDEPDLERANRVRNAAFNNLERIMEALADEEEVNLFPLTPEPYHDLELAAQMGIAYYNRAQLDGAPEEVLERYRWYLRMVEEISQPPPQQAPDAIIPQPGAGAEMAPPMESPGMPPEMEAMVAPQPQIQAEAPATI